MRPKDTFKEFEKLAGLTKEHGVDYVASAIIEGCQKDTLEMRRRAVMFVAGMRGHCFCWKELPIEDEVGECPNCGMIVKLGKGRGAKGNLVERDCVATGRP